jgi:hypothetical protein
MDAEEKELRRKAANQILDKDAEENRVVDESALAELERDYADAVRSLETHRAASVTGSHRLRSANIAHAHERVRVAEQRLLAARAKFEKAQREQDSEHADQTLEANLAMADASREAARASVDAARAAKTAAVWTAVAAIVTMLGIGFQVWQGWHAMRPAAPGPAAVTPPSVVRPSTGSSSGPAGTSASATAEHPAAAVPAARDTRDATDAQHSAPASSVAPR